MVKHSRYYVRDDIDDSPVTACVTRAGNPRFSSPYIKGVIKGHRNREPEISSYFNKLLLIVTSNVTIFRVF